LWRISQGLLKACDLIRFGLGEKYHYSSIHELWFSSRIMDQMDTDFFIFLPMVEIPSSC